MSPVVPGADPWAEAAALIADVGRSAENARRYRALADTIAETAFDRALAAGSEVRRAARAGTSAAIAPIIAELQALHARCEAAIGDLRASAPYREMVRAFEGGETGRATELASAVFSGVVSSHAVQTLYWTVLIGGGRSADHFLPATDCAERIRALAEEGVAAPTKAAEAAGRGGDAEVLPIRLAETHDESESPIALAFEAGAIPGPVGRLAEGDVVLFYARRLRANFTVSCAPHVSDEWWKIRPDAYRIYLEELRAALTARSLSLVIEPAGSTRA